MVAGSDTDARELLARVVARSGHDVEQVTTASEAVGALGDRPRLALLALYGDARAPELVAAVRGVDDEAVAAVPVIVVTDDAPIADAATRAGADGTLTRPFHADELTTELEAVLARSPEERAEIRAAAELRPES